MFEGLKDEYRDARPIFTSTKWQRVWGVMGTQGKKLKNYKN